MPNQIRAKEHLSKFTKKLKKKKPNSPNIVIDWSLERDENVYLAYICLSGARGCADIELLLHIFNILSLFKFTVFLTLIILLVSKESIFLY